MQILRHCFASVSPEIHRMINQRRKGRVGQEEDDIEQQEAGEAIRMTTARRPQLLTEDYFPKTFSTSPTFF
jgi:hypothetical protein